MLANHNSLNSPNSLNSLNFFFIIGGLLACVMTLTLKYCNFDNVTLCSERIRDPRLTGEDQR